MEANLVSNCPRRSVGLKGIVKGSKGVSFTMYVPSGYTYWKI